MRPTSLLPPAVAGAVVLVASLGVHLHAYLGLVILDHREEAVPATGGDPIEFELVPEATDPREEEEDEPDVAEADEPLEEEHAHDEPPLPQPPAAPVAVAQAAAEPEPEPPPLVPPPVATPPPPAPRQDRQLTSVEHRSRDPDVEPPPDAQHLAAENSRVEEETMARIRNPNLNDPEPQAPAASEPRASEEEGDAPDEEMAELDDAEGSDERDPTPEETVDPRSQPRPEPPPRAPRPAMAEAARGGDRQGGRDAPGRPSTAAGGGRAARGGGDTPMREVLVSDGIGTFSVLVPEERRPEGEGEGDGGGVAVAGRGRGTRGEGTSSDAPGRGRRRARGGGHGGRGAPNLRLSWSQFASLYGEEELRRQRELYLQQRRSRLRGSNREENWRRFRAAIENYDVRVRPGNQTALNTRMDPFAAYVASMHRRIHPRFAEGYLRRLPSTVEATFRANQDMHTRLEIGIDAQGSVAHISVRGTSGDTLFDLGAFEAVMGGQPYSATPENIRSPDGLVYVHWSFYRNHRQCGTFNAEMYILASAPAPSERRTAPPGLPAEVPERARPIER